MRGLRELWHRLPFVLLWLVVYCRWLSFMGVFLLTAVVVMLLLLVIDIIRAPRFQ